MRNGHPGGAGTTGERVWWRRSLFQPGNEYEGAGGRVGVEAGMVGRGTGGARAASPSASGASRGAGAAGHAAGFSALAMSWNSALRGPLDFLACLQAGSGVCNGVQLVEGGARLQKALGSVQRPELLVRRHDQLLGVTSCDTTRPPPRPRRRRGSSGDGSGAERGGRAGARWSAASGVSGCGCAPATCGRRCRSSTPPVRCRSSAGPATS